MVKLRILEILESQNHTKYWLFKQLDLSYQNFNRMVNNETSSIRFENLDKLSTILNCPVGDLFEKVKQQIIDQANEEARAKIEQAQKEIETEKKQAQADMKQEIVDVAIEVATKVMNKEMNEEINKGLVEEFVDDVVN